MSIGLTVEYQNQSRFCAHQQVGRKEKRDGETCKKKETA
jgi:hypothetical protein